MTLTTSLDAFSTEIKYSSNKYPPVHIWIFVARFYIFSYAGNTICAFTHVIIVIITALIMPPKYGFLVFL